QHDQAEGYICITGYFEAAFSRLYSRQARLLLFLLRRQGVYIAGSDGQVFSFRKIGGKFGSLLRALNESHYIERSQVGNAFFSKLDLGDQLIHEHFSGMAECLIAATAKEGLNFFFIGADSNYTGTQTLGGAIGFREV